MWCIEVLIMMAMVALNAVFAAYEIALASVSLARLQVLVRENRASAKAALRMKEDMEGSLAVVQLGITLVGVIAAATGGAGAGERLAPLFGPPLGLTSGTAEFLAIVSVVVPLTGAMIVFGELLPKVFALRHKEWVCLRLSPVMGRFALASRPVVWLVEGAVVALMRWGEHRWRGRLNSHLRSEAEELLELRALASLARTLRLIGSREESIILGAAQLSSHPVREILLPAEHIVMLGADDSPADALAAARRDMHTRFPVAERAGDPQSIIGYVTFKDIAAHLQFHPAEPSFSLRGILRPIPSLQADCPITAGLERLIYEHAHIALIRDGSGRVMGMITLEDILEELVGEIEDEYDRLPGHASPSGAAWVVGGGIPLAQLKELTGIDLTPDLPRAGVRHLSGWVTGQLGRPPRGGDMIERHGLRILVRKVRRQKVLEAQVGLALDRQAGPTSRTAVGAHPL